MSLRNSVAAATLPIAPGHYLSPKQRKLYQELLSRNRVPADLYSSALSVLNQSSNPCRYILAGHALREMVKTLPRYLDIPQPESPANIKDKINQLKEIWDKCSRGKPEPWEAPVDASFRKFIKKVREFFAWYDVEHTIRHQQNIALVRATDPSAFRLPQQLEDLRVKEWQGHYNYFVKVAHLVDQGEFEPDLFDQWLAALEDRLLQMLVPRTFDEFRDMDEILEETEG
jgi:hypothetical protein